MHFETGMVAPEFNTEDIFGNPVNLADYRGKNVLLSFFRNSACALCNLRVHRIIQRYPEWQANGLEVVAVFESPLENMRQYVGRQEAPFPLVSDPEAKLYNLFGVEVSEEKVNKTLQMPQTPEVIKAAAEQGFQLTREEDSNFNRMPAEFLIGPDGRILEAHYAVYIYDHLPFEIIERYLKVGAVPSTRS